MIYTYLITILFVIIYGLGLIYWEKNVVWRLNPFVSKTIKTFHYSSLLICLIVGILYSNFEIGLRGLWTTRGIILLTITTGVFFVLVSNRSSINKLEKWYFRIFSFFPILTAFLLFVPFLGVVIVFSLFGQLFSPATTIYHDDDKLRVQSTFVGVLGPPRVDIYEKSLFFEKRIIRTDFWANEIDSIQVSYDSDSTRIIVYGLYDYDKTGNGEKLKISLERKK